MKHEYDYYIAAGIVMAFLFLPLAGMALDQPDNGSFSASNGEIRTGLVMNTHYNVVAGNGMEKNPEERLFPASVKPTLQEKKEYPPKTESPGIIIEADGIDLLDDGVYWGQPGEYFGMDKTTYYPGDLCRFYSDIHNDGSEDSGPFTVNYYLSADPTITTGDYFLGYTDIANVECGNYADSDGLGNIPETIPAGTYYLGCVIDSENEVSETDETNNIAVDTVLITIYTTGIDLLDDGVYYCTPGQYFGMDKESYYPGETFSLWQDIRNRGVESSNYFYVDYYLSTDTAITTEDYLLGRVDLYPDGVNARDFVTIYYDDNTIPAIPAGWYYLGCIIDAEDEVSETDETNNIAVDDSRVLIPFTITVPHSGQAWKQGTTKTIKWNYAGDPGANVKIDLLKGGVMNRVIKASTPIGSGGSGSYVWKVPFNQAIGTNYKIRITSTTNSAYKGMSDADFAISAGAPITVIQPNGGESWKRGNEMVIRWKYTGNPGSKIKIELLKGGVVNRVIKASTPIGSGGSGSYVWNIPANQALGTNYKIRITSITQPAKKDTSNKAFSIKA